MRLVSAVITFILIGLMSQAATAEAVAERAKIGLALSGGGARGGAHIGVLKALEELQIPIDYIAGTSMGAIVGGFYAAGHSVASIEEILEQTDWTAALSDAPERSGKTMRKKALDSNFLIPLRIGFNGGDIQLPLGVIEGQKIDQILKRAILMVKDTNDFDGLRIPFKALATDLVTGEEVVMASGSLTNALRASMSVPGFFAPVVMNGRKLVDGGLANNLPISVVREMGADIIIAVDISSPLLNDDQINSVFTVTEQLTNFLTRRNTEEQIDLLGPNDHLFIPQLDGFSAADFDQALSIVPRGYEVVMESSSELRGMSLLESTAFMPTMVAAQLKQGEYIVNFIEINNDSVLNDEIIRSRLDISPGDVLDLTRLDNSIDHIYSIDVFQTVTYDLVKNEMGETGVAVNATSRTWGPNYLQFGIEITDDFSGNTVFGFSAAYTRNAMNSLGGELRFDFAVGREDLLQVDFYQPIDKQARWFVEPRVFLSRRQFNIFNQGEFETLLEASGGGAALGLGRNFNATNLLRLEYEYFKGKTKEVVGSSSDLISDDVQIGEFSLFYRHDSHDNIWFPTTGKSMVAGLRLGRDSLGSKVDYEQAVGSATLAYSIGKTSALLNIQGGYSFDDAAPLERWFELGGFGRLSGLIPNQLVGRHFGLATLAMYRHMNVTDALPIYAGFTLEAGNTWDNHSQIELGSLNYSTSLFVGSDTPIGPVYLAYGVAESGENTLYFFLGNPWKNSRF
jgi:NTE family protein